jgi:hypothetical protein
MCIKLLSTEYAMVLQCEFVVLRTYYYYLLLAIIKSVCVSALIPLLSTLSYLDHSFYSFSFFFIIPILPFFSTHFSHSYNIIIIAYITCVEFAYLIQLNLNYEQLCMHIYLDKLISFTCSLFLSWTTLHLLFTMYYHFTISTSTIYLYTFQSIFYF